MKDNINFTAGQYTQQIHHCYELCTSCSNA